jgi:orc1/cdc6 family replication initiation protein
MDFNSDSRIISRADLLMPETIPYKITGRSKQMDRLRECMRPMGKGAAPFSAWLYGPAGSGKTAVARKVAGEFCQSAHRVFLYVNCWERPTLYSVVQALCEQLKVLGADAQDTNVKLSKLSRVLRNTMTLIILDEFDRPMPKERDSIVYRLLQLPRAGLFCISNTDSAFLTLETRNQSRLSPVLVHFPRYSAGKVEAILADRALDALTPDVFSTNTLQAIAPLAQGDARLALRLLFQAALAAENDHAERIGSKHIPSDRSTWARSEQKRRIESLPEHQRLVYELVRKHKQISSTSLRSLYETVCSKLPIEPVAQRTFSKYIALLARNNFLAVEHKGAGGPGRLLRVTNHRLSGR